MPDASFDKLVSIVEVLRSDKGCPWDRKQTVSDLKNYILEEAYELCDAVDKKNCESIKEELGDLFLLLVFFSSLFSQKKQFTVDDVLEAIVAKLIIRHPHVFGSSRAKSAKTVLRRWIHTKGREKKRKTAYDRIPKRSPALNSLYIFMRESIHLSKTSKAKIRSRLKAKLNLARKANKKDLTDIIFYASCLIASGKQNPELLLRTRVKKEASSVLYEYVQNRKTK